MPLTTNYTGVHGIAFLLFPLIKRWKEEGHEILFFGKVVENNRENIFCNLMCLKPYIIDVSQDMIISEYNYENLKSCDLLYVYNRPDANPEVINEYLEQNVCISIALSCSIPVLFFCGDLWFLPSFLSEKVILLRAWKSTIYDSRFKSAYYFENFTHNLINYKLETRERIIDYIYIGNFYNRFDEFKAKFASLEGKIVVAGSWIRDQERWSKSLTLKNILFVGMTPFSMSLPLLNISKKTLYVVPKNYRELDIKTSRIYEAKMAGCRIDEDTSKLNTLNKADKLFWEIVAKESK
ncbi:hypothetical protein KKF45_05645 [Patescibacteria group bacterium]|nr:hypothetical protein [Patescibacteria group bacterium]